MTALVYRVIKWAIARIDRDQPRPCRAELPQSIRFAAGPGFSRSPVINCGLAGEAGNGTCGSVPHR